MSEPLKSKSFVIRQSLFRRILILMTLAAVAIGVIVVGLFRMSTQRRLESRYNIALRNIGIYAKGVSAELDHFKDSELQDAVERLLQERGFLTRVRLPDGRYVESKVQRTDDIFSNAETIDSWLWRKEGTKFAFVKGRPVLSVAGQSFHGNREYLFTMERPDSIDFDERILVLGIALPLLVIGLLYQGVRRMLLPLKTLQQGVESVSQGNLAVQLDDSGHDELAVLANSFNRMTFELKRMMASREELLLGVSHELRTPLTRARLAVEMLPESDRKLQLGEDFREMSLLVDELLEFGRLRGGLKLDTEVISVREVLRWSQEIAGALPEFQSENGIIAVVGHGEILEKSLKVDRLRVVRIIRNLLENAARYATRPEDQLRMDVGAQIEAEQVVFFFRDNGKGIPESDCERIFEPFSRIESSRSRKYGGLGLGLSLARSIAEAHGGSLMLTRYSPAGAEFRLSLPLASQD